MKSWKQWFPYALAAVCLAWVLASFRAPAEKEMQSQAFGRIPMMDRGTKQSFESFARNALMLIRGKQSANYEPWKGIFEGPRVVSALDWAMELMFKPELGDTRPIFRIDNLEVKSLFQVPVEPNAAAQRDGKHYSWIDLQPKFSVFKAEAQRASAKEREVRSVYESKLVDLWGAVSLYRQVKFAFGPAASGDVSLSGGLKDYIAKARAGYQAYEAQTSGQPYSEADLDWLDAQYRTPLVIPPHNPKDPKDTYTKAFDQAMEVQQNQPLHFSLERFARMAKAYKENDAAALRSAAEEYLARLAAEPATAFDVKLAAREPVFHRVEPFYKGMFLCVLAFLLCLAYWVAPTRLDWLRRSAVWLGLLVLVLHLSGQIFRMIQEQRPPVTNLYSSAIFIGLMVTIFGLLLEKVFPYGIGITMAVLIDFSALFVAHFIALRDGVTTDALEAVLDTNFWLATHVVSVTMGYVATFLAGFLGLFYVLNGAFSNRLAKPIEKKTAVVGGAAIGMLAGGVAGAAAGASLAAANHDEGKPLGKIVSTMIYAIICFGVLFSFVGTVLGGIWADQSWGRFWGWDVKENGALMIVLWNALILHARWGGIAKERGVACLAVLGNAVTAWSWFGVNNLGIGLHSYGFTSGIAWALGIFVVSQVAIAILGRFACEPECVPRGQKAAPVAEEPPRQPGTLPAPA